MEQQQRLQIVKDEIRRFPDFSNRTIARVILHDHPSIFEQDLEKVRSIVRRQRGAAGHKNREQVHLPYPVTPMTMPLTRRAVRTPYRLSDGLWLVFADTHVPFHEPKPIEAAFAYAKQQKVDGILIDGDLQDYPSISYWTSQHKQDMDEDMKATIDFLDFIRYEFAKEKKVYKLGNHEYRVDRYYQSNKPELIGLPLIALEKVYNLEERGFDCVDYNQMIYAGKLPIIHGHEVKHLSGAVNPARGLFLKTKSWAMCAHSHRTSEHSERDIRGTLLTTWSIGCLCDLSPDYEPMTSNWNWGFALINVEHNGDFEVENRRILPNGKVV